MIIDLKYKISLILCLVISACSSGNSQLTQNNASADAPEVVEQQEVLASPLKRMNKDVFADHSGDLTGLEMSIVKNTGCGCCDQWVEHLKNNGAIIKDVSSLDQSKRIAKFNMPEKYSSCHTGVYKNFIFEGHVPASAIKKFIDLNSSEYVGLSVPGMPIGSPGMENGNKRSSYNVLAVKKDGSSDIFMSFSSKEVANE